MEVFAPDSWYAVRGTVTLPTTVVSCRSLARPRARAARRRLRLQRAQHGDARFGRGDSLANLLALGAGRARALSLAVIAAELALPVLCYFRPRLGLAGVVVMHAGFALVVPGVWSFGLAMIAMATLYVVTSAPAPSAGSRRR